MAEAFYEELRLVADELLAEFGFSSSLRRKTNTGAATRACVLVNIDYSDNEKDGQIIQANDRRFMCAAGLGQVMATPPSAEEDMVLVDGKFARIVTSVPIKPALTPVVYIFQVRQT